MRQLLALILLMFGSGAPAAAAAQATITAVATTQANARRQGAVVINGITWTCAASRCTTSAMPSGTVAAVVAAMATACQGLAREVGGMSTFAVPNRGLTATELQACNSVVTNSAAAATSVVPIGKSLPKPDPAKSAPPAAPPATPPPPAGRRYPVMTRTAELTVSGTGRLAAPLAFTPKSARTAELTVTGTGRLSAFAPFTPKVIRTVELTVTGTGVIR